MIHDYLIQGLYNGTNRGDSRTVCGFISSLTIARFRWVTCQLDYLCGFSNDFDRRRALGQLPPTLHDTYIRLLQRFTSLHASSQSKIQMCLHFIAFSPLRLTINDIRTVISTPEEVGSYFGDDNLVSEDELASMCGSLLRKTDDGIFFEFAHFSVREFLEHESLATLPGLKMYQISREKSNEMLAVQSLRFLQLSNFDIEVPHEETLVTYSQCFLLSREDYIGFHSLAVKLSLRLCRQVQASSTLTGLMRSLFHPRKSARFLFFAACLCFGFLNRFQYDGVIPSRKKKQQEEFANKLLRDDFQPIHLAAALNLPDVCDYLIGEGSDSTAASMFGTPFKLTITSFISLILDGCGSIPIQKHCHLCTLIQNHLDIHQRNATFEIFENTSEYMAKDSTPRSQDASLVEQAIIIAFAQNNFCILQKLLSRGMELEDTTYTRLIPDLMFESSSYIQSNENPLLSFLQNIASRVGSESKWPLMIGRVIWNTAVELELSFTRDPTVTDSRISLSKDALVTRAFATIKSHDINGLQECLADGRLDLSQRYRDPLEPQDDAEPLRLTLLHFAVIQNDLQATSALARAGCDPNIVASHRNFRWPPIHDCSRIDIFEELSVCDASATDVEVHTGENIWHLYGSTAEPNTEFFESVAQRFPSETAEALLTKSKHGHTPLQHLLVRSRLRMSREDDVERVMALIEICGGVVDFWSRHEPTFGAAASFGSERVIRRLIEVGAGAETIGSGLETPLHRINAESSSATVQCLKTVFPEAVHTRFRDQLPLQAYLERCLRGNHHIDDSVAQEFQAADSLESIDGRRKRLWEYYCHSNTTKQNGVSQLNHAVLWAWLLRNLSAMQVYEKRSGRNGLTLILSRLVTLNQIEDLTTVIPAHAMEHAMDTTDSWDKIKSDSKVLQFLQFAIEKRAYPLISLLISRGVSIHDQVNGYSAMQIAFNSPLVAALNSDEEGKQLLNNMMDHSKPDHLNSYDRDGFTILHTIATRDSDGGQELPWLIRTLVAKGADVDRMEAFGVKNTPMTYHLHERSVLCAMCMLEMGADPELAEGTYSNALLKACWTPSLTFLTMALDQSKSSGRPINWGRKAELRMITNTDSCIAIDVNAIHHAVTAGNLEVVEWYVDNGLIDELEAVSAQGWTPMHCAAFCGHASIIEYLVSKGCNTMPETSSNITPLHMSVCEEKHEATKALIRLGATDAADAIGMTARMYASRSNNESLVQLLDKLLTPERSLEQEFAHHSRSRERLKGLRVALENAITSDDIQECQRICEIGCPINVMIKGSSPLALALQKGHLDIAEWLLDNGATTVGLVGRGTTERPYTTAIELCLGNSKLCKLLSNFVDQSIHDGSGWPLYGPSCFVGALKNGNTEGLAILLNLLQERATEIRYLDSCFRTSASSWS